MAGHPAKPRTRIERSNTPPADAGGLHIDPTKE